MGLFDFIGGLYQTSQQRIASSQDRKERARIAEENLGFQYENLAYQKQLQKDLFAREDSAVQRRIADLKKAGLSPTLAAGSAAGAGAVVQTTAPQRNLKLDTKESPGYIKGQYGAVLRNAMSSIIPLVSGYNSILQQKQNIAYTKAQEKLVRQQLKEKEYNLKYYMERKSPVGAGESTVIKTLKGAGQVLKNTLGESIPPQLRRVATEQDIPYLIRKLRSGVKMVKDEYNKSRERIIKKK